MSDQPDSADAKALLVEPSPTLPGTVPECHALISQLLERVQALEERINLDSNNSSKPPSSDGPGRPNRAQRRASTKKRGAQPGHKGHSRSMIEEGQVDRIHDCRPQSVCGCGGSIIADDQPPQRHQVFDVPPMKAVRSLSTASALWMDETHYRRQSAAHWVWAAVQPKLAVFSHYPSRARYVIRDIIGSDCAATITSDRYAAYAYIDPARRQVCWAHLLRDFNRIAQRQGLTGRIGRRLLGLGLVMFRKCDRGQLKGSTLEGLQRRIHAALTGGANQSRCLRTARTCANILALWTFTTNPALEPTNNAPEQALRSIVLKRKISGPSRSLRGDRFIARGFTAHETCLRQGRDLWQFLHRAVHAFIAGIAPPSLLPQARPAA